MRPQRLIGTGVAAVALAVGVSWPAHAADSQTAYASGPPSGVAVYCPSWMQPVSWTVTDGDGNELDSDQRVRTTYTVRASQPGVGAWIAPYLNSPPPPDSILLTVVCSS